MANVKVFSIDQAYEDLVKSKGPWKRGRKGIPRSKVLEFARKPVEQQKLPKGALKEIGRVKEIERMKKKYKGKGVESFPHQFPGVLYREGSIL
jgi:hypothetical protein